MTVFVRSAVFSKNMLFKIHLHFVITCATILARDRDIKELCDNLDCDIASNTNVCGVRNEGSFVHLRLFDNECALLKHGCALLGNGAYGLINIEDCRQLWTSGLDDDGDKVIKAANNDFIIPNNALRFQYKQVDVNIHNENKIKKNNNENQINECADISKQSIKNEICAIRRDGKGYRVKLFSNNCDLLEYNSEVKDPFIQTDMFICEGALRIFSNNSGQNNIETPKSEPIGAFGHTLESPNRVIFVDGSLLGSTYDVNKTIDNFFAATHVFDLPIMKIDETQMETRRRLLKNAGPIKVFQPWITIPKEIKSDVFHRPTLSSCYHKCPTECPDTYAPVCGVPGIIAREPSIMFKNHCYMDVAQCKMFWENKSITAVSSSYIESSFVFCLGDQLNGLYRFLPLIKTLQHMGRLKKKAKFRYRLKNLRFFNNLAFVEPKLMG